jgi:hydroxypyruvate reductase
MLEPWEGVYEGGPRADIVSIFKAGLDRADPLGLIERCLALEGESLIVRTDSAERSYDLRSFRRIILSGFGKASARMALGVERLLGERISAGLVVTKAGYGESLERAAVYEAAHPLPDERSLEAARRLVRLAREADEESLVVNCVSGGGSSLLCAPGFGLGLEEERELGALLLASGAPIGAVNCARKHVSLVKGGRLAAALYPATSINLILSDVVGDDLSAIASGPTVPDPSTWSDALAALERYGIRNRLSPVLRAVFEEGAAGALPETPKPGEAAFLRCGNFLVGGNRLSLIAAKEKAEALGYSTLLLSSRLEGEARELARVFAAMAWDIRAHAIPRAEPACVIAGGESTVTLRGRGKGGRNQEMALAFLEAANRSGLDLSAIAFLSAATDGGDGPTDAAGGIADAATRARFGAAELDAEAALADNASYDALRAADSLVVTGPTKTNVCDIQVLTVGRVARRAPAPRAGL